MLQIEEMYYKGIRTSKGYKGVKHFFYKLLKENYFRYLDIESIKSIKRKKGSGALLGKMLLLRTVKNNNIDAHFRLIKG